MKTILTPNVNYSFLVREVMDTDPLVVKEAWVENVYQINDGDFYDTNIFIDIGANIGAVSLQVASFNDSRPKDKQITVYAYEPLTSNVEYLNKNIRNNNKQGQIKIHQLGVWEKQCEAEIIDAGGSSSILENKKGDNAETEKIRLITLEQVFEQNRLKECDVMKIDIEGAEYQTLLNSSKETLKKIKYLTLEFDGGHQGEFGQLVEHLAEVFNIHIIGKPSQGGYIYGRRY